MLFVNLFDKPYNMYVNYFDSNLDLSNYKDLLKKYPEAQIFTNSSLDETFDLDDEENMSDIKEDINVNIDEVIIILPNEIIAIINPNKVSIYYSLDYKEFADSVLDTFEYVKEEEEPANVRLVCYDNDYYTVVTKIEKTNINISENYNDDFLPVYNDLVKFVESNKSGIAILRGVVGSGKTSVIRNLITNHPAKYILITTTMAEHLAQPTFMTFMQNNKDSIFILEDCEQILVDRTSGNYSCAITNILNTADGLMSDIFNIKFICTFNADISKIDKALLRKGRCFVNYEFKELSEDKTKVLLNRQGIKLDSYKPMTLADIYNYTDTDCTKQTNKIGF
ncbi:MAG: AAA family ATPase [Candidatus Onthovivens sp.]|nr:AAA family ATPase [Candidatus Onthovivens sp.]